MPDPVLLQIQHDAQLKRVKFELDKAIKGRAMAGLLFNREQQLRKEDADRHMVELEEVRLDATAGACLARGYPYAATNVCSVVRRLQPLQLRLQSHMCTGRDMVAPNVSETPLLGLKL